MRWRLHLGQRPLLRVCEPAFLNCPRDRRLVPRPFVDSGEGMPTHEKDLEDDDCQSKGVVVDGPVHLFKGLPLQLRRSVFLLSDATSEQLTAAHIMERIAVNDRDQSFLIKQRPRLVDVADNSAKTIYAGDRTSEVERHPHQEPKAGVWKLGLPVSGCTKLMHQFRANRFSPRESCESAVSGHCLKGKSDERRAFMQSVGDHRIYFAASIQFLSVGVYLYRDRAVAFDMEYLGFAAFSQNLAELQATA